MPPVTRCIFDNLTPLHPDERFKLEATDPAGKDMSSRVIDLVAPLGKGQACADCGAAADRFKTVLLQNIAKSITANHPDSCLIVLLIDETSRRGDGHETDGKWRSGVVHL